MMLLQVVVILLNMLSLTVGDCSSHLIDYQQQEPSKGMHVICAYASEKTPGVMVVKGLEHAVLRGLMCWMASAGHLLCQKICFGIPNLQFSLKYRPPWELWEYPNRGNTISNFGIFITIRVPPRGWGAQFVILMKLKTPFGEVGGPTPWNIIQSLTVFMKLWTPWGFQGPNLTND